MTDIRNMRTRLKALSRAPRQPPPTPTQKEEEEDQPHRLTLLHHELASTNQVLGVSAEEMIGRLPPHLELLQDLVISSPDADTVHSRMKCLRRLAELWQEGKEAMVVAPQRRAVWTPKQTAPHSQIHIFRQMAPSKPTPSDKESLHQQQQPPLTDDVGDEVAGEDDELCYSLHSSHHNFLH